MRRCSQIIDIKESISMYNPLTRKFAKVCLIKYKCQFELGYFSKDTLKCSFRTIGDAYVFALKSGYQEVYNNQNPLKGKF